MQFRTSFRLGVIAACAFVLVSSAGQAQGNHPVTVTQATSRAEAEAAARASIGRRDPMQQQAKSVVSEKRTKSASHVIATKPHKKHGGFVLPPPPYAPSIVPPEYIGYGKSDLAVYVPEVKPLAQQLRLIGIMEGKAVLALPAGLSAKNDWPRTITMSAGEKFDSIRILSVSNNTVTLQEGEDKSVKGLEPL
jgi:hypothetical protein